MHEINIETIQFYAACWAIAFAASFMRSSREITRANCWNVISRSCLSGFLAFGIVGLLADGQRDFGENHALELQSKARELPADIRWHFIGHLQTNKVKTILPYVHLIHSVDSPRLVDEIQKRAAAANRQVGILWQVHIAQEETKHGFEPESLLQFLEERPPSTYPNLRPCGLMGMATLSDQSEDARPEFAFLKNFLDRVKQRFYAKDSGFDVLSMGMSGDYSIALQEGSTMLRIGSLLFER